MKKICLVIFISIGVFFVTSTSSAFAQDYTNQTFKEWAQGKECGKDNKAVCAEAYSNFMSNSLMYSFSNMITGSGDAMVAQTPQEQRVAFGRSALGSTTNLISYMYTHPPASGVEYIAQTLHNFSLTKQAYAQGIGYSGLSPIQPIWRAFRNLAYGVLVIVLVAIGFMIMFRMKMGAQTAVTIQSAIPNIIITLLLITFSYAIAGLLIDLMYFLIMLVISVFVNAGLGTELNGFLGSSGAAPIDAQKYQEFYVNANTWDLLQSVMNFETIVGLPNALIRSGIGNLWLRLGTAQTDAGTIAQFFGFVAGSAINLVGGALLTLLISLGLLFVFVRLFFIFLNSYIQILLSVILAPVQLLMGAVPGQNTFRNWLMGLIGNLVVFPTAVALFMLNLTITVMAIKESGKDIAGTDLWIPPFLFGSAKGSQVDAATPIALIGFGILMLTPTLINTVKGLFAPKPILPIGAGTIFNPLVTSGQSALSIMQQRYYLGQSLGSLGSKAPGWLQGLIGVKK